ncbi:hypothetical protein [Burkholderia gladioli]|uniref:hypothetical protein n=1 Tax=Burkholderia gladioli TaxID=28095 RepID=UPI00163DF3A4|nr:hypothetical protein [Burkholderia gladioli]
MDTHAIDSFCERWICKASNYDTDGLEDLFDRFYTLFVPFNRLYSACAEFVEAPAHPWMKIRVAGDRFQATEMMARCISQKSFNAMAGRDVRVAEACQRIAGLLEQREFYLHSIRGTREPDHARDIKLAEGLRRSALVSVLNCLYQIRCNTFHGEKEFAPRQAALLAPANVLLAAIVELSREALRDIARG